MPIEFHYFSLILIGLILARIILKVTKERLKKIKTYLTVVNTGILIVFNLIMYSFSDQYRMILQNQVGSYVLIALIILINVTVLIDIIKINKKDWAA